MASNVDIIEKTILYPSPNWFQPSIMKVGSDGWIIYGGLNKSLCLLIPNSEYATNAEKASLSYRAHLISKIHSERIISVDISPEWPEKRHIISGCHDGFVKISEATFCNNKLEVKTIMTSDAHYNSKENLVAVGYSTKQYAFTLGVTGNVVKWDLSVNSLKHYNRVLWNYKPTCMACSPHTPCQVAIGTKQAVIILVEFGDLPKVLYKIRGHNDEMIYLSWCPQYAVEVSKPPPDPVKSKQKSKSSANHKNASQTSHGQAESEITGEEADTSDKEIVEEEDLFDMYKDHSANEFGHKKYVPEDILVKVKPEEEVGDFLAECNKLKSDILKLNTEEPSIETLVHAFDKTNMSETASVKSTELTEEDGNKTKDKSVPKRKTSEEAKNVQTHLHLLASVSRNGVVQIWSKSGKQVGVHFPHGSYKNQKAVNNSTILWFTADVLLVTDHFNQIVKINPLDVNHRHMLQSELFITTPHRRQPYCLVSSVPRVQTAIESEGTVWTISQDRYMVQYCVKTRKMLSCASTTGGFVYSIATCPYDANRLAVAVGDSSIRVGYENDLKTYWQNLQGVILTCSWHPTQENLLAFGTGEARVGTLKPTGNFDRPARTFQSALSAGVYSISWSPQGLYAVANGELALYNVVTGNAEMVDADIEGRKWKLGTVLYNSRGLLVTSRDGSIALLSANAPHTVIAVAVPYTKLIHSTCWHPEQVSSSSEMSPHSNLLALCANEKHVTVLKLDKNENGDLKFQNVQRLEGHTSVTFTVQWNPHREGMLLSTSADLTVRIWSVLEGVCTHIYAGHSAGVLCASWATDPNRSNEILSGGSDYCLRLWDYTKHPAELYVEVPKKRKTSGNKKLNKKENKMQELEEEKEVEQPLFGAAGVMKERASTSKHFLLPIFHKESVAKHVNGCRKMFNKYLVENGKEVKNGGEDLGTDYIKMFGTTNEFNELLDLELENHSSFMNKDSWIALMMLRGRIADMMQYAIQNNVYSPMLLSITPCVSNKFWKDHVQLYVKHIEKMITEGTKTNIVDHRSFGGTTFLSVFFHLAIHQVDEAVNILRASGLIAECYLILRSRHRQESLNQLLGDWAKRAFMNAQYSLAATINIHLKDLPRAVKCLIKSNTIESLQLAAEIAEESGEVIFSECICEEIQRKQSEASDAQLEELPSRLELMLREKGIQSEKSDDEDAQE